MLLTSVTKKHAVNSLEEIKKSNLINTAEMIISFCIFTISNTTESLFIFIK